jgi:hypothetical protein
MSRGVVQVVNTRPMSLGYVSPMVIKFQSSHRLIDE